MTKRKVVQLCRSLGLKVSGRPWGLRDIRKDCELVFVGSGIGVLSPSSLEGRSLGPIGARAMLLWEKYREWIARLA